MLRRTALFLLATLACASKVLACAPAPPLNERIDVAEESAVIVWEPATKTEHFIRRATFLGKPDRFGFLVPTPTAPRLAAVEDRVFDVLEAKTRRGTVHTFRHEFNWTPVVLLPFLLTKNAETPGRAPVDVLSTQKVAGYDAAVLDATDAKALGAWLETNGYASTPDLAAWLEPYIRQRWIITAFKIDKGQSDLPAQTSAVKMSFTTDRPFFPYREPASQREYNTLGIPRRLLVVFFLGPDRVDGTIGAGTDWPGDLQWSDTLDDRFRNELTVATSVPIPAGARLTAFHDTAAPRPGTDDLFFAKTADQGRHVPPPWVIETTDTTHVPLDVIAIIAWVVVGLVVQRRRRRSA